MLVTKPKSSGPRVRRLSNNAVAPMVKTVTEETMSSEIHAGLPTNISSVVVVLALVVAPMNGESLLWTPSSNAEYQSKKEVFVAGESLGRYLLMSVTGSVSGPYSDRFRDKLPKYPVGWIVS